MIDRTDFMFWFPAVQAAGLYVPDTRIVQTDVDLACLLDGKTPRGLWPFIGELQVAASEVGGPPFFLRTAHGSGKHEWENTCFVRAITTNVLARHVGALVEWSHTVDMFGLPHETWVVRRLIPTQPLFRCEWWGRFPVTREFRVFVDGTEVEAIYPYWPADAFEHANPDRDDWRERLATASELSDYDTAILKLLARQAALVLDGGYWSIDFLQDEDGAWWLTDMADGDRSWKPSGTTTTAPRSSPTSAPDSKRPRKVDRHIRETVGAVNGKNGHDDEDGEDDEDDL